MVYLCLFVRKPFRTVFFERKGVRWSFSCRGGRQGFCVDRGPKDGVELMMTSKKSIAMFFWKLSSCKLCHRICCDVEPTEETYSLSSSPPSQ